MNINIICIGKLKEKHWKDAAEEYIKRLQSYCKLTIHELKESRFPNKGGPAEEMAVKEAEGSAILNRIKDSDYVITLEIEGAALSSEKLAEKMNALSRSGKNQVVFVIGGSFGLSEAVSSRSNYALSFSKMTFPHQMARVILLEQIYRNFKISRNETYHK